MADLYSRLGVKRGADEAAIKSAYRKLAKDLHPDRNKENPKAAERFAEVTQAYDLLSDKDKRAQYDRGEIDEDGNPKMPFGFGRTGANGGFRGTRPETAGPGGVHGGDFDFAGSADDLLSELFGGGRARRGGGPFGGGFEQARAPVRGRDVQYKLPVDFIDAAELKPQRVTLRSGRTIDVKLPAGFADEQTIKLKGLGEEGPGGPGDALIKLSVRPHRYFRRDGDDIRIDVPVRLDEAVLGAKVRVPTTSGSVMVTVPKGTAGGTVLRLKGKGFTKKKGGRGDQLVTLEIDIPKGDADLETFVKSWEAGRKTDPRAGLG